VEQLLAESTGKDGKGVVPVPGEPFSPENLGEDRIFVAVGVPEDGKGELRSRIGALRASGRPVLHLELGEPLDLGAEMYRWEYATAVCGRVLGIHPFDQPDVQAAKTRTNEILEGGGPRREAPALGPAACADLLRGARAGDYVALMVYGDPDAETLRELDELRSTIRRSLSVASTLGIGPRFLHSTGQLHKGGPDRVIALQWLLDEGDLPIPGRSFGFGELIRAQADGDLRALEDAGRRVARVGAGADPARSVRALREALS
jgi:hypothetical protein